MLGTHCAVLIFSRHEGQVAFRWSQVSRHCLQKQRWQHCVSTTSVKNSQQMGHTNASSCMNTGKTFSWTRIIWIQKLFKQKTPKRCTGHRQPNTKQCLKPTNPSISRRRTRQPRLSLCTAIVLKSLEVWMLSCLQGIHWKTSHTYFIVGNTKLIVVGLSQSIEQDSIRVSGECFIDWDFKFAESSSLMHKASMISFRMKLTALMYALLWLFLMSQAESTWLKGFADTAKAPSTAKRGTSTNWSQLILLLDILAADQLTNVANFLKFYQDQLADIDSRLLAVSQEISGKALSLCNSGSEKTERRSESCALNWGITIKRS